MKPMRVALCSAALILASIAFSFAVAWLAQQSGWWVAPAYVWALVLATFCGSGALVIWVSVRGER